MEIRWIKSKSNFQKEKMNDFSIQVGPMTNFNETQCFAEHLTTFTSSFTFLPSPIDWNRVFSHADFISNPTIYLTVIIIIVFYIFLMIYSRRSDRKDRQRKILFLVDNYRNDKYFYQILMVVWFVVNLVTVKQVILGQWV